MGKYHFHFPISNALPRISYVKTKKKRKILIFKTSCTKSAIFSKLFKSHDILPLFFGAPPLPFEQCKKMCYCERASLIHFHWTPEEVVPLVMSYVKRCALFALEDILGGHSAVSNIALRALIDLGTRPATQVNFQKSFRIGRFFKMQ